MNFQQTETLDIIHRLMGHFEVTTYSDFADKMKIARNLPSMWAMRGKFPFEIARALCESENLRLDWIYFGMQPKYTNDKFYESTIHEITKGLNHEQKALLRTLAANLKD